MGLNSLIKTKSIVSKILFMSVLLLLSIGIILIILSSINLKSLGKDQIKEA